MVAETCSGNCIKDAMVCLGKCRFGSFFRESFSGIKKNIYLKNFPDFRYIPIPGLYYTYLGIHARSLKCL